MPSHLTVSALKQASLVLLPPKLQVWSYHRINVFWTMPESFLANVYSACVCCNKMPPSGWFTKQTFKPGVGHTWNPSPWRAGRPVLVQYQTGLRTRPQSAWAVQ